MIHQKHSLTLIIGIGILAALLLASCSQDGDGLPGGKAGRTLMVGSVSMTTDGTAANTRTSAGLPVPVTSGDLWVGVRAENGYESALGKVYTYQPGSGWTTVYSEITLNEKPVSLYAYWPYAPNANPPVYPDQGGAVILTSQPYSAGQDLGYAVSGGTHVNATHPYAGFVLSHAYARIKLDLTFSDFFKDDVRLDAVYITAGKGLYKNGTLIVENGTVVTDPTLPLYELRWEPGQTLASLGRKFTAPDVLIVPAPAIHFAPGVEDAALHMILSGVPYSADLGSLQSLDGGKIYTIRTTVKTDAPLIVGTQVTVEDWNTGTAQSGDMQIE